MNKIIGMTPNIARDTELFTISSAITCVPFGLYREARKIGDLSGFIGLVVRCPDKYIKGLICLILGRIWCFLDKGI